MEYVEGFLTNTHRFASLRCLVISRLQDCVNATPPPFTCPSPISPVTCCLTLLCLRHHSHHSIPQQSFSSFLPFSFIIAVLSNVARSKAQVPESSCVSWLLWQLLHLGKSVPLDFIFQCYYLFYCLSTMLKERWVFLGRCYSGVNILMLKNENPSVKYKHMQTGVDDVCIICLCNVSQSVNTARLWDAEEEDNHVTKQ